MSSKIIGAESEYFASMVVDAVTAVRTESGGRAKYPVGAISILKAHGRSSREVRPTLGGRDPQAAPHRPPPELPLHAPLPQSELVNGFALNCTRASQGMPKSVKDARIALLDFDLRRHRMQMGVQVLITNPRELEAVQQREMDITREKIKKILDAGANVILTTKVRASSRAGPRTGPHGAARDRSPWALTPSPHTRFPHPQGIDDLCLKYLVESGVIGVRRVKKEDIRRIARATGGQVLVTMATLEGEEAVEPESLGRAELVSEDRVGDNELIYIRGCATSRATTIVLRGPNEYMLDEMDRSLHDALMVIKRCLENRALVVGGGSVDAALHVYLDQFATTLGSREQLAVHEFAEALLVIPKTLATNAACDVTELTARLCAKHAKSQCEGGDPELRFFGLDLVKGVVENNLARGVVEPAISKIKSLRFATEAAVTILRIDDSIKVNPKEEDHGAHPHP